MKTNDEFIPENLRGTAARKIQASRPVPASKPGALSGGQIMGVTIIVCGFLIMIWNGGFGDSWREMNDHRVPYGYQLTAAERHDRTVWVLIGLGVVVTGGAVLCTTKTRRTQS